MTNARIRWAIGTALATATIALAACSDGADPNPATTPTPPVAGSPTSAAAAAAPKAPASAQEGNVRAVISNFTLPTLTVKVGSVVEFVNQDSAGHTATSDDKTTFDSKTLSPSGGSFKFTASKAGVFNYACSIHSSMKGSITVQ